MHACVSCTCVCQYVCNAHAGPCSSPRPRQTISQLARVGAGFFIIFQLIELINLIYVVNEYLLEKDAGWSWAVLVVGALGSALLGLAACGLCYYYYVARPASCGLNLFFISFSLAALLAMVGVLFVPNRVQSAGLMTSGCVFAYTSYVLVSAMISEPNDYECIRDTGTSPAWVQAVGFFIALAAVVYSTIRLSTGE